MNVSQEFDSRYSSTGYSSLPDRGTDSQTLSTIINKESLDSNWIRVDSSSSFQAKGVSEFVNFINEIIFRIYLKLNSMPFLPYDAADEERSHFVDEKARLMWVQVQMEQMMREYTAPNKKKSVVDGDELLRKLKTLPNTPEGFLQLDTVLRPSRFSIEELKEEAYLEKYGI